MPDKNTNEKPVEIHVTEIFGLPIIRRYVETRNAKNLQRNNDLYMQLMVGGMKVMMVITMIIAVIATLGILYYPPPMLYELTDTLLNNMGNMRKGSEIEELHRNLSLSEIEKTKFQEGLEKCVNEKAMLTKNVDEVKGNFAQRLKEQGKELEDTNEIVRLLRADLGKMVKNEQAYLKNENKLKNNVVTLNEQIDEIRRNENQLKKTVTSMHGEIDDARMKLDEMEKAREERSLEFRKITDNMSTEAKWKDNEITQCKTAKNEFIEKLKESNRSENELAKNIQDIQIDYLGIQQELTKMKKQVIPEFEKRVVDLNKELSGEKMEKTIIASELSKREVTISACRNKSLELQRDIDSLQMDINSLEKMVSNLEGSLLVEKNEKVALSEDLKKSKLTLGTCKNKNMDHETSNADLLVEIEGLKKQLEKC